MFKMEFLVEKTKPIVRYALEGKRPIKTSLTPFGVKISPIVAADHYTVHMVNGFINDKGVGSEVYGLLEEAIGLTIDRRPREEMSDVIHRLVNLLPYDDWLQWLHRAGYIAPAKIADEVNKTDVSNERITERKTYTKREYMELLPLIGLAKLIGGILMNDGANNGRNYPGRLFHSIIIKYIIHIDGYALPLHRLTQYIDAHKDSSRTNDEILLVCESLEIAPDTLSDHIAGVCLMKSLFTLPVPRVPLGNVNAPTTAYNSVTSNLPQNCGGFRVKPIYNGDDGEREPRFDAYRTATNITTAHPEEFMFATSSVPRMLEQLSLDPTDEELEVAVTASECFNMVDEEGRPYKIADVTMSLIEMVTYDIIPTGAIDYIDREYVRNLAIVTFLYIRHHGINRLANFVMMLPDTEGRGRPAVTVSHIDRDLVNAIKSIYLVKPVRLGKKEIEKDKEIERINSFRELVSSEAYVFNVPADYLIDDTIIALGYRDLRTDVARLVIALDS